MIEPIFWLVVLAIFSLGVWGWVHEYRAERQIKNAMKELDRELDQ